MRGFALLLSLLTASSVAGADTRVPVRGGRARLPDGVVISGECTLLARRGAVTAEVVNLDLTDGQAGGCPSLTAIILLDDGSLQVTNESKEQTTVSAAHLAAALDRADGNALARKRPADAEKAFERALAAEPDEATAAALARVRLAQGQPERAAEALAPYLAATPVEVYARALTDARLRPVLETSAFAALRSPTPGDAHVADERSTVVAWNEVRKLYALVQQRGSGCGCNGLSATDLVVFNGAGVVATIALRDEAPADERVPRKRLQARLELANRLLADLGFMALGDAERAIPVVAKSGADAARFPIAGLGVARREGTLRLLQQDEVLDTRQLYATCDGKGPMRQLCEYEPGVAWVVWLPSQRTILLQWSSSGAEHTEITTAIEVWPIGEKGGRAVMPLGANPESPRGLGA